METFVRWHKRHKAWAFPTWALTRMMLPFFSYTHPWKGRKYTLERWWLFQTDACREIDLFLWISGYCQVVLLLKIAFFLNWITSGVILIFGGACLFGVCVALCVFLLQRLRVIPR